MLAIASATTAGLGLLLLLVGSLVVNVGLYRARAFWLASYQKAKLHADEMERFAREYLKLSIAQRIHQAPQVRHYPHQISSELHAPEQFVVEILRELVSESRIAWGTDPSNNTFFWAPRS
jgi:hypothetical protein